MQDNSTEPVTIYALHEPGEPEAIRYIGATRKPLEARLKAHLASPWRPLERESKRARWIAGLWAQGGEPGMRALRVVSRAEANEAERAFIASYEAAGVALVNGVHTGRFRAECHERMLEWWQDRKQDDAGVARPQPGIQRRPADPRRVYKLTLWLPAAVYEDVQAMAHEEIRTLQQQIIYLLRRCVAEHKKVMAARAAAVPAPQPEGEGAP